MPGMETARMVRFELEVELDASPERAWTALTDDINAWWLPDYRAAGTDSVVRLEPKAGGSLVEEAGDGASLVWYTVQMVRPGKALYLVGHLAPDWGGPGTSMLKLALAPQGDGSVLRISDAIVGNVTEEQASGLESGWRKLFGEGLAAYLAAPKDAAPPR